MHVIDSLILLLGASFKLHQTWFVKNGVEPRGKRGEESQACQFKVVKLAKTQTITPKHNILDHLKFSAFYLFCIPFELNSIIWAS